MNKNLTVLALAFGLGCAVLEPAPIEWTSVELVVSVTFAYQSKEGGCSDVVAFVDANGDGWCRPSDLDTEVMVNGEYTVATVDIVDGVETLWTTVQVYADEWDDRRVYEASDGTLFLGRQVEDQSEVDIVSGLELLEMYTYVDLVGTQDGTPVTTGIGVDLWAAEVTGGDAPSVEVVEIQEVGGVTSPIVAYGGDKYIFVEYQ